MASRCAATTDGSAASMLTGMPFSAAMAMASRARSAMGPGWRR